MATSFVAGKTIGCTWTISGSTTTLNVTDHTWAEMVDAIDVTHTGTSGVQSLIAGVLRGEGTVKGNLDVTSASTAFGSTTVGIIAGTNGVLTHSLSSGCSYTIPAMIVRVNSAVPVNGAVNYEFTVQLNEGASTVTYARDFTP